MCGQCVLSVTGMACPTNCAKGMRNGPCGGVRLDGSCEVDAGVRCVWVEATQGRKRIGRVDAAADAPVLAPRDYTRADRSTWIEVVCGPGHHAEIHAPAAPAASVEPAGFERACRSGGFLVTVEVAPPDSADPAALIARAGRFGGLVDAINITDGAGGNCHMSSVAASAVLVQHGLTPVYQVACRDRNRIAIQGDILGAAALGVQNILCLTGDDVSQGDHPQAKPVFDLDAVSLLHVARGMCDRGEYASGRKLQGPPDLFIGATANPFVPPYVDRIANLEKKIVAGARFIQTQFCFDLALFEDFMREVRRRDQATKRARQAGEAPKKRVEAAKRVVREREKTGTETNRREAEGAARDRQAEKSGDLLQQAILRCVKKQPDVGHCNHWQHGGSEVGHAQQGTSSHAFVDPQGHHQRQTDGQRDGHPGKPQVVGQRLAEHRVVQHDPVVIKDSSGTYHTYFTYLSSGFKTATSTNGVNWPSSPDDITQALKSLSFYSNKERFEFLRRACGVA